MSKSLWLLIALLAAPLLGRAASAMEIDARADQALAELREIGAAAALAERARGVLIFPRVIKAGFGIGGEFGEGVLRVNGKSVAYYNIAAASVGFQIGGQVKKEVILFMTDDALDSFRGSHNWQVGVDGSVAIAEFGVEENIDSHTARAPIIGFVFGNKGLMYNLTLEGAKITPIKR